MSIIRTVGHGTASASEFAALLTTADVDYVVDVRRFPGSRRHPQFSQDDMRGWLTEHGLGYAHAPSLGGRRKLAAGSPNTGLRNKQFRAYADHMYTAQFVQGVEQLMKRAAEHHVAVMCSESVWWRCHRRLLSDHLILIQDAVVEHLFHDGRLTQHAPTAEARLVNSRIVYDDCPGGQHSDDPD